MKRFVLFLILSLSIKPCSVGQSKDIDSLKSLISTVQDTTLINIYSQLSETYRKTSLDSSLFFASLMIEASKNIGYKKGECIGLRHMAGAKMFNGNSAEALDLCFEALEIARLIDDEYEIGRVYNSISVIYAFLEKYDESLENFFKALEILERSSEDKVYISNTISNIGNIYYLQNKDSLSEIYLLRALKMKYELGEVYGAAVVATNLGLIAKKNNSYDEALLYFAKADSAYLLSNDKRYYIENLVYTAEVYFEKHQTKTAWFYINKAYEISRESNFRLIRQMALKIIIDIKERQNKFKEALKFQKEYQLLSDSLIQDEQVNTLEELKAKFELEEKNREIELLQNQQLLDKVQRDRQEVANYLLIISVVFMVLILALLGWAYLSNRKKNTALIQANLEKDQFISVLSHDIKAPLNTLKGVLNLLSSDSNQVSKRELKFFGSKIDDSIDNLIKLVNGILSSFHIKQMSGEKINTIEVHTLVKEVIELHSLTAYQKNIKIINKSKPEAICLADLNALSTVLRNLLSNALKYCNDGDTVTFETQKTTSNQLQITVTDTGVGISKEDLPHLFNYSTKNIKQGTASELGSGLGLALSKELIEKSNGFLNVNSEEGMGTSFKIILPIQEASKTKSSL